MEKLKLATVIGTRPEIIRLAAVIKKADRCFDHVLIHTGQNWDYTLNEVFFKDLGLRAPDYYLECAGAGLGETMGSIITKSFELLDTLKPDALLLLGDTNSTLAAIPAKRLKIPIFHMEAGNRCWDWNVPEMVNRTIVDRISDINLPYTENSRHYLLSEGFDGKTIFVTGSPMPEVLENCKKEIDESPVLDELGLEPKKYFLLSAHREENIDDEGRFISLMSALNVLAEEYGMPVVFSTHPRTKAMLEARDFALHPLIRSVKPFGFIDYNKLQKLSYCVLSDSGTLSEEATILNFPAVLLRTSTERPEALDNGSIIVGGINRDDILRAVSLADELYPVDSTFSLPADYRALNVSDKVVRIIESYTKIVNETTWGR